MPNKKKLKSKALDQAKSGNLSDRLVNRLTSAGVNQKAIDRFQSKNTAVRSAASSASQPEQQTEKPLTGNPIKDNRYGYGAQKEAQKNYNTLTEQGVTDAFNPGNPGSYKNSMADGFFGKKELKKFANMKDIDRSQARRRITAKGGSLTAGANKMADKAFAKNNPLLAMMLINNPNMDPSKNMGTSDRRNRELQIFKDSSSYDYKNRLPGEVFTFRPKQGMQGGMPVPNVERLGQIFSNPLPGDAPPKSEDPVKTDETETGTNVTPETVDPETTDPGVGMMAGGGNGAMGASKLLRARSRLQRLGILNRGTGLFGRGLQYGNTINA